MDTTDILTQFLQYCLGVLPGDVASNIVVSLTFTVTLCTFILRFWKEPAQTSRWRWVWKIIHLVAAFRLPQKQTNLPTEGDHDKKTS